MKHKKLFSALLSLIMVFSLVPSVLAAEGDLLIAPAPTTSEDIVILYTNDIHTYINKDLTYSKVAALKDSYENVLLVTPVTISRALPMAPWTREKPS